MKNNHNIFGCGSLRLFGLIGYPLGHSFSKDYFTAKFRQERIDASYELFELPSINDFPDVLNRNAFSGLNVTIPYKEQVIPFLEELDETAEAIGAVNVIQFLYDGHKSIKKGFNTDVIGFIDSISPLLQLHHRKALILGTGGAAKAIDYGLCRLGLTTTFVSRKPTSGHLTYSDLTESIMLDHSVVVNTTPVGMFPHVNECPPIPYRYLTLSHLLFDAVYNPAETLFLSKGKAQGAITINGLEMLKGQALAAWKIWNDTEYGAP